MIFLATVGDRDIRLKMRRENGQPVVEIADHAPQLDLVQLSQSSYSLLVDGRSHHLSVRPSRDGYLVDLRRRTYHVRLRDELDLIIENLGLKDATSDHSGEVTAPIPGLITSVAVAVGAEVDAGEQLLILEAMKMENEIAAPKSGRVAVVHVSPGDAVEKGAPLVELEGCQGL
ncbi:MAG: acetyl-CoA carboxylase biotin carboxyl carrier protein subunit [Fidelibacterota bacterium]|nr:MAG: acetyl-CoA carboxylase biotin carboxyl carrier protein subunit [Candidatus Neomarinimicrobiota bacterium]